MYRTLLVIGFLVLSLPRLIQAKRNDNFREKRSVDLNDIYHFNSHQYVRLPQELKPNSYNLHIEPLFEQAKFRGLIKINVTVLEISDWIILNAHPDIRINQSDVKVTQLPNPEERTPAMPVNVVKATTGHHPRRPWYSIGTEQMLKKGSMYEVEIAYMGNLTTNETTGFFMKEYTDPTGKIHPFAATYFRPDHAKKMFPCVDEPPYKATFKLSVKRPKQMTSISNMPIERTAQVAGEPEKMVDYFKETPMMSTYQFALIISDLQSLTSMNEVNVKEGKRFNVKIWARKDYLESVTYIPDKVVTIVNYLQEYFNASFGISKLDLIAVPMYNAPKASDSWGLMFFKESELSSPLIWNMAYELIYQWIGQYITPYRWSDAPINKALNSFLASMTTVDINPSEMEGKWPMTMLYSLYYEFGKVAPFSRVSGIRHETTSAKIELIFRMFNYTLGKDLFRQSVRNFIKQKSEE